MLIKKWQVTYYLIQTEQLPPYLETQRGKVDALLAIRASRKTAATPTDLYQGGLTVRVTFCGGNHRFESHNS